MGQAGSVIQMTPEEWRRCRSDEVYDPEFCQWMAEKGIAFDSGHIEVEVDGERMTMQTRKDDFGTQVL